ncbi:uncharacterized protein [Osmerus mordax]|uniref:uncharacterized protein n=1 Tax=Osmerus mordax TaxID=8014 RepID=UPI00350FE6F4
MSDYVSELSGERLEIAEQTRRATIEILQDALEKKFYGFPVSYRYSCADPVDPYTFCCIPTEKLLTDLLKIMKEIQFRQDTGREYNDVFAYVRPRVIPIDNNVYLCELFWSAPDNLCEDSKPGTLIHEVSHLLGTDDITYEWQTVVLYENYGTLLGRSKYIKGDDGKMHCMELVAQVNANSLEYEFETIINHKQAYLNGRYACCGETKENSVCRSRETGHYHLHKHFEDRKKAMEESMSGLNGAMQFTKIKNGACRKSVIPK